MEELEEKYGIFEMHKKIRNILFNSSNQPIRQEEETKETWEARINEFFSNKRAPEIHKEKVLQATSIAQNKRTATMKTQDRHKII